MLTQKSFLFDFDTDDEFGNWLAGFVDGEGCFRIAAKVCKHTHIKKNGEHTIGHHSSVAFQIRLRLDDIEILLEIKDRLKCGNVRIVQGSTKHGVPIAQYIVANASDLKFIIVPFFEKYRLRAKKKRDFEIWKRAVDIYHLSKTRRYRCEYSEHLLPESLWQEILKLNDELKEIRKPKSVENYLHLVPNSKLSKFIKASYNANS